jgi:protein-S-isoprenylcysteine O-methyltransferase Ste14
MSPELSLYLIWVLWALSWVGAGFWSAPTVKRVPLGSQILYRVVTFVGFLLLFGILSPRRMAMTQLWRLGDGWRWWLVVLVVLGFAFSWWGRVHLGRLWSAAVTRKKGHQVIDTGPYALVRHPIYSGIILASVATAALRGTLVALIGAAVMAFGWYLKARLEEEFLREELGAMAYDDYAARTPMLLPFVKF